MAGRREWFIDHDDSGWNASAEKPRVAYDQRVSFGVRPDEDDSIVWLTFKADDAIKLGKALVKVGKKAKEARRD